jgi:hypothetical protein
LPFNLSLESNSHVKLIVVATTNMELGPAGQDLLAEFTSGVNHGIFALPFLSTLPSEKPPDSQPVEIR